MPIVTVSGSADIDYERAGSGRDMLLLHSLLTDRHAFDDVGPLLAPHRRLTLLNLPGFGRSSPAGPAIEDYADRVAAAFPALGLPPATDVVAMSFGGFVGSALASRHGGLFDRLVLVDTAAAFPEPAKVPLRAKAERAEREGMAAVLEVAVRRIFTETFIAAHPDIVEARKATLLRADTGPFAIACRALAAQTGCVRQEGRTAAVPAGKQWHRAKTAPTPTARASLFLFMKKTIALPYTF